MICKKQLLKNVFCASVWIGISFSQASSAKALELEKYCPDRGKGAVHILLIDQTEVFDSADRRRLEAGANALFADLEPGERIDIYPMNDRPGQLSPVARICVPGCPDDMDEDDNNWSYTCDRIRDQQAKRAFRSLFLTSLIRLANNTVSEDGTELLRTLSSLNGEYRPGWIEKLTIFSDMIEYSDLSKKVNHFDEEAGQKLFSKATLLFEDVNALQNIDVSVFGFGKRLGQQELIDSHYEAYLKKGFSESTALELAEKEAVLPNDPRTHMKNFWQKVFGVLLGAKSVRISQNY